MPTARKWLRFEIPRRCGISPVKTGKRGGIAMAASTNVVQITGEANGSVHPAIKVKKAAGADSVRRRLSSIFQRLIGGIGA